MPQSKEERNAKARARYHAKRAAGWKPAKRTALPKDAVLREQAKLRRKLERDNERINRWEARPKTQRSAPKAQARLAKYGSIFDAFPVSYTAEGKMMRARKGRKRRADGSLYTPKTRSNKPPSAYNQFVKANYHRVANETGTRGPAVFKQLGQLWRQYKSA